MKECIDVAVVGCIRCCLLLLILEELPHKLVLVFVHIFSSRSRVFVHICASSVEWNQRLQMKLNEEYRAPNGEALEGALEDGLVHRNTRESTQTFRGRTRQLWQHSMSNAFGA
jgi:hypothetical protein